MRRNPPCRSCIHQSEALYAGVAAAGEGRQRDYPAESEVQWFAFDRDPELAKATQGLNLKDLMAFTWSVDLRDGRPAASGEGVTPQADGPMPLGALCVASMRWILRRHTLPDDEPTRYLYREYLLSAWNVARQFTRLLDEIDPSAVVVFNGQYFPEAVARLVAKRRGLRVVTHEVGLQPASAFFTEGEATAYPISIPPGFELSESQATRLDAYLEQRFQGKFTMGGIQFWPHMRGLGPGFLENARRFPQLVPVFTNVVFDTSQSHANTVFPDMFAWLDMVLEVIKRHPETLFVIRAHPDETRLRKESRETVQRWVAANGVDRIDNVAFVAPTEYLSSYELIQRAKFVMVYNSTIGLEASIMGKPVLCGGRARYTQLPTVFFPQDAAAQRRMLEDFLAAGAIQVPPEFKQNARRFLYLQLFRASLPFDEFLLPSVRKTQARLRRFAWDQLQQADSVNVVVSGLLDGGDFLLQE